MTEQEMRDSTAPTFETVEELSVYINDLVAQEHDYGTCCYAMSLAATASFNFVASKLGVTGFQASCADLDVLRRTRCIESPFAIIKASDMVSPQYDLQAKLGELMDSWMPWAAEEAAKNLAEKNHAHPNVKAHWERLAATLPAKKSSGENKNEQ